MRDAAGERFSSLELNILVPLVAVGNADPLAQAEGVLRRFGIPPSAFAPEEALRSPAALVGSVDKIIDDLHERRERYGFSYVAVFGSVLEDFAPVVARLAGT